VGVVNRAVDPAGSGNDPDDFAFEKEGGERRVLTSEIIRGIGGVGGGTGPRFPPAKEGVTNRGC